jgi:hypothetical protein
LCWFCCFCFIFVLCWFCCFYIRIVSFLQYLFTTVLLCNMRTCL